MFRKLSFMFLLLLNLNAQQKKDIIINEDAFKSSFTITADNKWVNKNVLHKEYKASVDSQIVMSENFEGTFPSQSWSVYAKSGFTDAYWGKILLTDNTFAAWCASSGAEASTWAQGYMDDMNAWMIYGPFNLGDAIDAVLEFHYNNDSEPDWDTLWYAYSENGINFTGIYNSGNTGGWQFVRYNLESIVGKNDVYIGFIFTSDETNEGDFKGALIDNIVIKKFTEVTYPAQITLNKSYSFGDVSQSSSYRLIGIPGNNNLPITTFFNNGTQKTDWNVFYDNGAAENFLTEFNGQALFNFTPGKGFWALSRNAVSVSRQVNTVTLTGTAFSIPLHSGWNIISNPFEKNVSFADIRNANTGLANAVFHSFSSNFTPATSMIPYDGYYFLNPDGRASLTIPYPFGTNLPKSNEQPYFLSEENLQINLKSENFSSEVMIGFDKNASNVYDDKDYFAPPGNFEELNIRLVNKNFSTTYNQLFIEHRPEIGEGQSFELQIKNETGKKANLSIKGIDNFNEDEIYLFDESLKRFYNLKDKNELEVSDNNKKKEFKLLIGKKDFIESYKEKNIPKEFALYQNYPNPFNPVTLIRYQIPEKEHVAIKVYDIIGNLVKVLVDETKEQGYYEIEFDGSSLSSGVYLYELSSGTSREIKKMTLIK